MRRRRLYIALLILLVSCAAAKSQTMFVREQVRRGDEQGSWQSGWFSIISKEVNDKSIKLKIDGRTLKGRDPSAIMTDEGIFMVPLRLLPDGFSCFAGIYDNSRLVMEKNSVRAEMMEGEAQMTLNGVAVPLESGFLRKDGVIYVPLEAVEKAMSYNREWKVEENTLELTFAGREERSLPYAYDYRDTGRAPRVKNQGSLGTCWAFASVMALESRLLPEEDLSLSEDHMSIRNSFHMKQNDGGEYTMSMAYLLAWQGPVYEKDDKYGDEYSPPGLKPVRHVQEIQIIPSKDYEAIKRAVYLYGGVQSSLYTSMVTGQSDSRYYNKGQGAYCYIGTAKPNHDIVIIGWDDNYPKENFNLDLEGDGAFICANSWGGEFGDEGYFYVSYYDTNIGIHNILYSRVDGTDNYDKIYQSDLCGWAGQLGYGKENAYFANIYTAGEGEELAAAGFYATGPDTSYEIYTVTDAEGSGQFGRRALAASGTLKNAGFYTIDFETPVELANGTRFAVIVSINTPGSVHPVAIEYNSADKNLRVDLSDGEGYISFKGTSWERVEEEQKCNICLKAYTRKRMAKAGKEDMENEG